MPGYTKTVILLLTENTPHSKLDDAIAFKNAMRLKMKGGTDETGLDADPDFVSQRKLLGNYPRGEDWEREYIDGPATGLAAIGANDRLYIVGHGTYGQDPTVCGLSPKNLATYLFDNGVRNVKVISLVSCNSGWGWGDLLSEGVTKCFMMSAQAKPFGSLFAEALAKRGISTEVRARIGYVKVLGTGHKIVELTEWTSINRYSLSPVQAVYGNKRSWHS